MGATHVKIKSGPAGHKTEIELDGVPLKGAHAFELRADCKSATALTVEFINLDVEVEGLIETTAFGDTHKSFAFGKLTKQLDIFRL